MLRRGGLGLDFAHPRPGKPWWSWLALLAGLAAAAWVGQRYDLASEAQAAEQARLQSLRQSRPAVAPIQRRDPAREAGQAAHAEALQLLDMPWGGLFATLQRTRPDDIALLSLEADGHRGTLSLTAEAKDYPAMIDYFRALQDTPGLMEISLAQHGFLEDRSARPVRFILRGRWGGGLMQGDKEAEGAKAQGKPGQSRPATHRQGRAGTQGGNA